jgi:hypothetical protein
MKKLVFILFCGIFIGCKYDGKLTPIEKYKNKGYVVIEEVEGIRKYPYDYAEIRLKSRDSVFTVYTPWFDGKDLKIGDTLK